jgi:hypothetical protein
VLRRAKVWRGSLRTVRARVFRCGGNGGSLDQTAGEPPNALRSILRVDSVWFDTGATARYTMLTYFDCREKTNMAYAQLFGPSQLGLLQPLNAHSHTFNPICPVLADRFSSVADVPPCARSISGYSALAFPAQTDATHMNAAAHAAATRVSR